MPNSYEPNGAFPRVPGKRALVRNRTRWLTFNRMPKYFFDVHDLPPALHEVGYDLPNDEAAWREATSSAGAMLKDMDGKMRPGQYWAMDVADQNHKPLFRVRIATDKLD